MEEIIAHYRIVRQLGAGGMGVVYEAEDTKLGRRVALKFLPEAAHRDTQAMDRFLREARSASALNHPGICTIHAIEDHNGRSFIAMELLEGQTFDRLLAPGPLPATRIVELGIQLADALDAAHKKGIVHRDIKPGNLFLTDRGSVKILDFGLAKLSASEVSGDTIEQQTLILTSPGTAVGTIAYMSPEQARGEELDARSDIFSLGAVLYEMITGRRAFPGNTSAVVFDNILRNAPAAPVTLNAQTPAELERILNKALEKDRDLRYQSAAELRADLKRLERELDPSRSASDPSGRLRTDATVRSDQTTAAANRLASETLKSSDSPSSRIAAAASKHRFGAGLGVLVVIAAISAAAIAIHSYVRKPERLPFEHPEISNLTNNGNVALASISPDGNYLLHTLEEDGFESLWLRNIPTGSATRVVAPAATRYFGLTFSRDGNYIYFVRRDEDEHTISILYRAPVLGGTPSILVRDVDSPVTFSPDGQNLAYLRERHDSPFWDLLTARSDGAPGKAIFTNRRISSDSKVPMWSPDGKVILVPVVQPDTENLSAMMAIDPASGSDHVFAPIPDHIYYDGSWLPDGSGLILRSSAFDSSFLKIQLGLLSYPEGKFRPLTTDANDYGRPSVSADGRTIVSTQNRWRQQFQVATAGAMETWQPVSLSSQQTVWQWDWLPDGRLLVPQSGDLRAVNLSGGESVVFSDRAHLTDQVASCGPYLVFRRVAAARRSSTTLWRSNSDGTSQKQLTAGLNDREPDCSLDGKWVVYIDGADSGYLKRVSIDGGPPETVAKYSPGSFALSSDGARILSLDLQELDHKLVFRVDWVEHHTTEYYEADQRAQFPFKFSPDGASIVYSVRQHGIDNLWKQDLKIAATPKQLTHFTAERIQRFAFSKDGGKIAIQRGHLEADAVLLRDASH
jgi:eukaryotic-like serine/threonine-protein kinase